ncbi:MAG: hypothetical protein KDA89_22265, partial [Planctomycetaceae bacterium]|nr:hypothetical protein [Planctomycetaceae bacterium]
CSPVAYLTEGVFDEQSGMLYFGTVSDGIRVYRRRDNRWKMIRQHCSDLGVCLKPAFDSIANCLWFTAQDRTGRTVPHRLQLSTESESANPKLQKKPSETSVPETSVPETQSVGEQSAAASVASGRPNASVKPDTSGEGAAIQGAAELLTSFSQVHSASTECMVVWRDTLYFNAETGLHMFDRTTDQFVPVTELPTMPAGVVPLSGISAMSVDGAGRLWLSTTDRRVIRISPDGRVYCPAGIPTTEIVSKFSPLADGETIGVVTMSDRLILLSTPSAGDDPATEKNALPNQKTVIRLTGIFPDDHRVTVTGSVSSAAIQIPLHFDSIQFRYSAPSADTPQIKRYQYRLQGLMNQWSEWGDEDHVLFRSLSPGTYMLEVRTRGRDFVPGPISGVSFHVLSPWYATVPSIASGLFVVVAVTVTAVRRKVRKARNSVEHLESVVAQRTADLQRSRRQLRDAHDDLERRVIARTNELRQTNDRLNHEAEERRETERRLYESEMRFRSIIEDQTEMIVRFDADGVIDFANEAFLRANEIPPEQVRGMNLLSI